MACNDICIAFMHGTSRRVGCDCMVGFDIVFGVRWWARYFGLHPMESHGCISTVLNKTVYQRLSNVFELSEIVHCF